MKMFRKTAYFRVTSAEMHEFYNILTSKECFVKLL
jgi:hypothetical protein